MAGYTQAQRPLRIDTALPTDHLMLAGFTGVEAVSSPFSFQLDLVSEHEDIDPTKVLRKPAVIGYRMRNGGVRTIHGVINRFTQLGRRQDLLFFRAELVPWLWFLSLSRDCRIFQNLSVPEIVQEVFKSQGYHDFDVKTTHEYAKRVFCVQYRETHLDFVSRLLEAEGIFYFFRHEKDRHVLVLADDKSAIEPVPGLPQVQFAPQAAPGDEVVTFIEREMVAHVGRVTLRDYDYLQPGLQLECSLDGSGDEQVYDYPGNYTTVEEGERYARLTLEAQEATRQVIRGAGGFGALQSGYRFELAGHFHSDLNASHTILRVKHEGRGGDFATWDTGPFAYHNEFLAIPSATTYRPPRVTPRPVIRGFQTARVVGPSGKEVYVDQHGRIKVQFHWDRDGKLNDESSCWVRVASPWAGRGWGAISIPRIGSEVVVQFLDGDPDRPIVVASVHNAQQTPPFDLPHAGIQMGMKSRSSPNGGGYNEISVTDTAGKEAVTIHAQYNLSESVGHDSTETVGNNRKSTVSVNDTLSVGAKQDVSVGSNQSTSVGGDQSVSVGGKQSVSTGSKQTIEVGADRSLSVSGSDSATAGSNWSATAGSDLTTESGAKTSLTAGTTVEVSAGVSIKLSAGGSSIEIGPAGVTIKGAIVDVQGGMIKHNA